MDVSWPRGTESGREVRPGEGDLKIFSMEEVIIKLGDV